MGLYIINGIGLGIGYRVLSTENDGVEFSIDSIYASLC